MAARHPRRTTATAGGGALFDDAPRAAADHRSAAATHAAAERWSTAVQEQMRAIVRSLEERALLDPRPGRTAAEAASEAARPLPAHAAGLRGAAEDFGAVTYGGRTADRRMYQRLRDLDADLRRTRPSTERTVGAAAGSPPA